MNRTYPFLHQPASITGRATLRPLSVVLNGEPCSVSIAGLFLFFSALFSLLLPALCLPLYRILSQTPHPLLLPVPLYSIFILAGGLLLNIKKQPASEQEP